MRFNIYDARGVILVLVCSLSTLWLSATGQLAIYIHPRYIVFTTVAAVVGLLLAVISVSSGTSVAASRKQQYAACGIVMIAVIMLLIIRPAVLTTATAQQRGLNSALDAAPQTSDTVSLFGGGDYQDFRLKDWAALLAQTNDRQFYSGKTADVTGFINPDQQHADIVFVSRYVLTCCAVDARPVGVPVYIPNWQDTYKADDWLQVKGGFDSKHDKVVIMPQSIRAIEQPKEPYEY